MSKKILGTTFLLSAFLFGVYGVFAYTSIDGTTNDRNTDTIKGDVDTSVTSTCIDLKSDMLRYKATDAATGGEVSELQDFLIAGGFLKTQATGYFGLGTFSAVKMYQKSVGLSSTGYVGALTKAKIKERSCALGQSTDMGTGPQNGSDSSALIIKGKPGEVVACTMEARLCPDGTMMPRDMKTCKWLDTKCGVGQGVDTMKQQQTPVIQKTTTLIEDQQRDYVCQKQKVVCDTSTSNFNGYACKETTALCDRLRGATPVVSPTISSQTYPSTTTRPFAVSCLYAAPPAGCTYVPGPDYVATSNCGMVLSCPDGGPNSGALKVSDPMIGKAKPGAAVCTMVMKFCPDGVTAMPRDSNCGWHPELCTGGDRPVGGSQPAPVLQSY